MNSILLLAVSHFKHKKMQSFLIGIILLVATLSFTIGLSVLQIIENPLERAYQEQLGSDLIISYEKDTYDSQTLYAYWSQNQSVEVVSLPAPVISDLNTCYVDGEAAHNNLYYYETPENQIIDQLKIVSGASAKFPKPNEVWLPTSFANSHDLVVGDQIMIGTSKGTLPYLVSALVIDLPYNSGFMNPMRAWFAPGEFQRNFPEEDIKTTSMSIRFKDFSQYNTLWEEFETYLGEPFAGLKLDRSIVFAAYSMQIQIMGSILLIFSVIAILIALYVLISTVNASVINDYQLIGIYRALGLTPSNIIVILIIQHIILALLFIPIGAVSGLYLTTLLTQSFMSSLGLMTDFSTLLLPAFISSVLMILLLFLCGWYAASKTKNIKPADAIRYGLPPKKIKRTPLVMIHHLGDLPLSIILGIKEMLNNRRQTLFSFFTLFFTAIIIMFSMIMYFSFAGMGKNAAFWGMDTSDMTISLNSSTTPEQFDALEKELSNYPAITYVGSYQYIVNSTIPKTSTLPSAGIVGVVYSGNLDKIGLINMEGRNPQASNEISVAANTRLKYDIQIGDLFEFYLEGTKKTFTVVGIYQGVNNLGQGFRIHDSAILSVNPDFHGQTYAIKTKTYQDMETIYNALSQKYGDTITLTKSAESFESTTKTITSSMGMSVLIMGFIFLCITMITIYNSTLLNINKQKNTFGILRSVGMTISQVRNSLIQKYILISLIAGCIALPLSFLLTNVIMTSLLKMLGIMAFPMDINILYLVAVIPAIAFFSLLSSWHASNGISKINPRNLLLD